MIIIDTENEKNEKSSNYAPSTQVTQLIYAARMPEPDLGALSTQLQGTLRVSDQDAPPTYEQVAGPPPQNASGSSTTQSISSPSVSFEPLVLHSRGKRLHEGFYPMLPPTDVVPHPFAQRQISTDDWKNFLNELQEAAKSVNTASSLDSKGSPCQSPFKAAASKFWTSFKTNQLLEKSPAIPNQEAASSLMDPPSLIDFWNTNIFHPRGIDVVLAKGPRRLSGDRNLPPPDYEPSVLSPFPPTQMPTTPLVPASAPSLRAPCLSASTDILNACATRRAACISASASVRAQASGGRGRRGRRLSVSSSSSSSDSEDDRSDVGSSAGPPTDPRFKPMPPLPRNPSNVSNRAAVPSSSAPASASSPNLQPITQAQAQAQAPGVPLDSTGGASLEDISPRMQRKIARLQRRRERKGERWDKQFTRKYARLERKLARRGLYLSPFLPVDLAMHGVGMGVGMGLRGIGMGLRGVGISIRGGKAPMSEAALADEEDGYYRLVVTDMRRT